MKNIYMLAVYGTLKRGHHNHSLLADAEYIDTLDVQGFEMYSLGGFPAIAPTSDEDASICAELFGVSRDHIEACDVLEGFSSPGEAFNFYERELIYTPYGLSYIYVYRGDTSRYPLLEKGMWL